MSGVLAPLPKRFAFPPEEIYDGDEQDGNEPQQTVAPIQAQCGEHLVCKKRECCTECRAEQVVACIYRSYVSRVGVAQVVEDGRELRGELDLSRHIVYGNKHTKQKAPMLKKEVPIIGTIQWISARAVQPNMNKQIGRQKQPTRAASRRICKV